MKAFDKIAQSKTVGKILDNPIVKKAAVPLGNAVISGAKKVFGGAGNVVAGAMKNNQSAAQKTDAANRASAPYGAVGGTNRGEQYIIKNGQKGNYKSK